MIYPVILAGGKGERFWPYSNSNHPKQLLPLASKKSLLEDTLDRIKQLKTTAPVHIITNKLLESKIRRIVRGNKKIVVIGEPAGKDTAPAIALAAKLVAQHDPEGIMFIMTADHAISPAGKFKKAVNIAERVASKSNTLVTFGIRPDRPDTGYGYIETGKKKKSFGQLPVCSVKKFHEKPDLKTANKYFRSKRYFWNSGMFAWKADYIWEIYKKNLPNIFKAFEAEKLVKPGSKKFNEQLKKIYQNLNKISIDYGIMEKAPDINVIVPDFFWDDIGSWSSLERLHKKDGLDNINVGENILSDSRNTICFSDSGMIAAYGVEDILLVQHGGVTLAVHKDKIADLKHLVKLVGKNRKLKAYI